MCSPKAGTATANSSTTAPIPTATGLLNPDCSAMAVFVFTNDHKAETIKAIEKATVEFNARNAAEFYETHHDVDAAYCDDKIAVRRQVGIKGEQLRRETERLKKKGWTDEEIAAAIRASSHLRLAWETGSNQQFVMMSDEKAAAIRAAGATFHDWPAPAGFEGLGPNEKIRRLIACFATTDEDIDRIASLF